MLDSIIRKTKTRGMGRILQNKRRAGTRKKQHKNKRGMKETGKNKGRGWKSKFSKPGFSSALTVNFQMFKLVLEKAEEPEIKLPTSAGS